MTDLTTTELAVCAALERLADENARTAAAARDRNDKDDARFFQRAANAYAKALGYYLAGLRPTPTPNGYLLPSQRPGEPPHLLTLSGDWRCTCQAGDSMHWAMALVIGQEIGLDDLGRFDGGDEEPGEEDDGDDELSGSDVDGAQYDTIPYPHGIGNPDEPAPEAIRLTQVAGALVLSRAGRYAFVPSSDPQRLPAALARLSDAPAAGWGSKVAQCRRRYLEAA